MGFSKFPAEQEEEQEQEQEEEQEQEQEQEEEQEEEQEQEQVGQPQCRPRLLQPKQQQQSSVASRRTWGLTFSLKPAVEADLHEARAAAKHACACLRRPP